MPTSEPRTTLRLLLERGDLRAALACLNAQVPHRYTSLYRFDDATLHNVMLYDREQPDVLTHDDIPVLASYCVFVRDGQGTFVVGDAADDARVDGHPKQKVFQSYCGVPLLDDMGRMFGTVCHFDEQPLPMASAQGELLESIAPLLQKSATRQ